MITPEEALDLLDALEEWYVQVEPKELDAEDRGLNAERYDAMVIKLRTIASVRLHPAHAKVWVVMHSSLAHALG